MFRTGNPAMRNNVFGDAETWEPGRASAGPDEDILAVKRKGFMTMQGTVNKSLLLLAICVVGAVVSWELALKGTVPVGLLTFGGAIAGLVVAMITIFKPQVSMITAPIYAGFEGLFVGGISALYATQFSAKVGEVVNTEIVMNAALGTFGTLGAMLLAYRFRIIKPTAKLRAVVVSSIFGIMLLYVASMIMSFFGAQMPFLHDATPLGIGISVFIIVIAALSLIFDFEFIENGVRNQIPTWGEWYGGFSLLVTLIWLYLEFLRLFSKLQRE